MQVPVSGRFPCLQTQHAWLGSTPSTLVYVEGGSYVPSSREPWHHDGFSAHSAHERPFESR
jgi:hypothetical protein